MPAATFAGTVFIVDDETSVRKSLVRLLVSAGYVVEAFASAEDFLGQPRSAHHTGCVLLDVSLPGLSGLDLQQVLQALAPPLPVIFLTGHGDVPSSVRAMKGGAVDYLTKPVCAEALLPAIALAMDRSRAARERHAERLELQRHLDQLTDREREVMEFVVRGWMNKQVAAELGTVEKTIKVHRARLIEKMGVSSLAELVLVAEKLGMFSPESGTPRPRSPGSGNQLPRQQPAFSGRWQNPA